MARARSKLFVPAAQIIEAADDSARAMIILQLPDIVLLGHASVLMDACRRAGFAQGATFLDLRVAALSATRDRTGKVPKDRTDTLDLWRAGMAALAGAATR